MYTFCPPLCSLGCSLDTSVRVQLVIRGDGPAYVCLGCEEAFLRPGTRADEWRSAVRCGMVGDTTARDFERQPRFAEGFSDGALSHYLTGSGDERSRNRH